MDFGELITRASVWLALILYVIAELGRLRWRRGSGHRSWARTVSSVGLGCYVIHVVGAFSVFHGWSHTDAYEFTARVTAKFTGWKWGGGLYVNYLFSAVWLGEVLWWWLKPENYRTRSTLIDALVRGFFLVMILNGAVVFVSGPQRWIGGILVLALLTGFRKRRR